MADGPIIIGGCGRSGTTLMRVMLDSHPRIAIGPESELLLPAEPRIEMLADRFELPEAWLRDAVADAKDRRDLATRVFERMAQQAGKARWGDKTPRNVRYLEWIFDQYPDATFIHMVRDGRDVVCSLRTHPRFRVVDGRRVPTGELRPLPECVDRWLRDTGAALTWRSDPRYLEVKYEDLVGNPEATMRTVLRRLGEPWDPGVLSHHRIRRDAMAFPQNPEAIEPVSDTMVARWRHDLSEKERRYVESRIADRLREFGYGELLHARKHSPPRVSAGEAPEFMIVGTPRSGTTLVQRLASELPGVHVPPETHFFDKFVGGLARRRIFPLDRAETLEELHKYLALETSRQLPLDAAAVVEALGGKCESPLHLFAAIVRTLAGGAPICGEKTPDHLLWWRPLTRSLPQLHIVALVRDPRAVVASNRKMPWGQHSHAFLSEFWRLGAHELAVLCASLPRERRLLLRYEDVVRQPDEARRQIARMLGVRHEDATELDASAASALYQPREWWKDKVRGPVTDRWVDRWRSELTLEEVRDIELTCRLEMERFGYASSAEPNDGRLSAEVEEQRRLWRTWAGWTHIEVADYERRFVASPARS